MNQQSVWNSANMERDDASKTVDTGRSTLPHAQKLAPSFNFTFASQPRGWSHAKSRARMIRDRPSSLKFSHTCCRSRPHSIATSHTDTMPFVGPATTNVPSVAVNCPRSKLSRTGVTALHWELLMMQVKYTAECYQHPQPHPTTAEARTIHREYVVIGTCGHTQTHSQISWSEPYAYKQQR